MQTGKPLTEEHATAYLAVLASRPDLVGLKEMNKRIGLTTCGFMVRCFINSYKILVMVNKFLQNQFVEYKKSYKNLVRKK